MAACLAGVTLMGTGACRVDVAPIEVGAGCPGMPVRRPSQFADAPQEQLIDDFEHEGRAIPRLGGRDGAWIAGSDGTSGDLRAEISEDCAGRGRHAGHFVGSGFSIWGANWTVLMRSSPNGAAVPYDATPYRGISFWAALGPTVDAPQALPVGVTTMDVAWNGGICSVCMDYYRTTVSLDHNWQRFEVPFEDLAQGGKGDPLVPLRLDQLVGFVLWPDEGFDIWLDDVRFEQ